MSSSESAARFIFDMDGTIVDNWPSTPNRGWRSLPAAATTSMRMPSSAPAGRRP
jgi:beta-phosphoglucomutase-like phosphatase (HAD superfamily)